MDQELKSRLEQLAFKRSIPFCFGCYIEAPTGRCTECNSDDLARLVPGHSVDWGLDHVIEYILNEELEAVNLEKSFEQMIRESYPETTRVAWADFDTVQLLKDQDPVSWRCALGDYESQEESEGTIVSFDCGSTYYLTSEIEDLVDA